MDANLQEIADAVAIGDKEEARRLLQPILETQPSADAWLLAARAAGSDQDTITYIQKALELDPQHSEATALYEKLRLLVDVQPSTSSRPAPPPAVETPFSSAAPEPEQIESATVEEAPSNEGVYEMLWDCRFCSTKKLLGKTHRFCPNCGSPQDPSWRYFPSDEEKVAVKDHVYVGTDVTCGSCGNLNAANAEFCGRCGAPLQGAEAVMPQGIRQQAAGQRFEAEDLESRINLKADAEARGLSPEDLKATRSGKNNTRRNLILAGVGVVVLGLCAAVLAAIFWTRSETVAVSAHRWEYQIEVEQLVAVDERDEGCNSMPADAYSVSRRREQVDTRRVQDGETCRNVQVDQGDGTFRQERQCEPTYREEPIMGNVCYYTVDRWQSERTVQSAGALFNAIVPPDTALGCTGERLGCEREGQHTQIYILTLGSGDEAFECAVEEEMWRNTQIEDVFEVEVGVIGGGARCDSLKRAG